VREGAPAISTEARHRTPAGRDATKEAGLEEERLQASVSYAEITELTAPGGSILGIPWRPQENQALEWG
jgi:hypothetical protein